jgi:hypothetical protein
VKPHRCDPVSGAIETPVVIDDAKAFAVRPPKGNLFMHRKKGVQQPFAGAEVHDRAEAAHQGAPSADQSILTRAIYKPLPVHEHEQLRQVQPEDIQRQEHQNVEKHGIGDEEPSCATAE